MSHIGFFNEKYFMFDANVIAFLAALVAVGLSAGFVAGLFGVGGGIIVVPSLYMLFLLNGVDANAAITLAVGTSLVTIIPTSIASMRAHLSLNNVDRSKLTIIAPPMVLGAVVGSFLVIEQMGQILLSVFSFGAVTVAFILIYQYGVGQVRANQAVGSDVVNEPRRNKTFCMFINICCAASLGFISSLSGVGGGALGVPWLMQTGLRIHKAVGTASVFGLLISLPAVISVILFSKPLEGAPFGTWNIISLPSVLLLGICTVLTAPMGAKLAKKFSERKLKLFFCIFLVCVGVRLLLSAFSM